MHQIIRFADKLGIRDEEMEAKRHRKKRCAQNEHAISVFTPSEERKTAAADILRDVGGKYTAYLGDFIITDLRK